MQVDVDFEKRAYKLCYKTDNEQLLELSGYYGVHSNSQKEALKADYLIVKNYPNTIVIYFASSLVKYACREIDILNLVICNQGFVSHRLEPRTGLKCLRSQVKCASRWGFKRIDLMASSGKQKNQEDNVGFYSWGRYGFMMSNLKQQTKFLQLIDNHGKHHYTLYDLLNTKTGKDFWMKHGDEWYGNFELSNNSASSLILNCMYSQLVKD